MFTRNLEQLCITIHPGERRSGRVSYPPRWSLDHEGARVGGKDTIHSWFNRCVDDLFDGRPELCAVEENLALFLVLKWDQRVLTYANCQAIWTEGTLDDFYLDGTVPHQYLRMDFDPTALGPMLKEALPHIHIVPDGEPRFGVSVGSTGDIIGEFVDFGSCLMAATDRYDSAEQGDR